MNRKELSLPYVALLALMGIPSLVLSSPRGPVIDVHVHTSPQRYGLVSDTLGAMGITRFVNLSGGTVRSGLAQSVDAAQDFDGRILVCVNIDWTLMTQSHFAARVTRELHQAKRMGAACIKISKALGLYIPDPKRSQRLLTIDDPILEPIWRTAGALQLPIFIHTGDPKAFFENPGPENERHDELTLHPGWSFADRRFPRRNELLAARDRVLKRHPETTFIGVHFANNPEDLTYVRQALASNPNLFVDIAARLPELGRHPPAIVRSLFLDFQDRILFGTDLGLTSSGIMLGSVGKTRPKLVDIFEFYERHFEWLETSLSNIEHPTPIQGSWTINAIHLPDSVRDKIYRLNAHKLLWNNNQKSHQNDQKALHEALNIVSFFD